MTTIYAVERFVNSGEVYKYSFTLPLDAISEAQTCRGADEDTFDEWYDTVDVEHSLVLGAVQYPIDANGVAYEPGAEPDYVELLKAGNSVTLYDTKGACGLGLTQKEAEEACPDVTAPKPKAQLTEAVHVYSDRVVVISSGYGGSRIQMEDAIRKIPNAVRLGDVIEERVSGMLVLTQFYGKV